MLIPTQTLVNGLALRLRAAPTDPKDFFELAVAGELLRARLRALNTAPPESAALLARYDVALGYHRRFASVAAGCGLVDTLFALMRHAREPLRDVAQGEALLHALDRRFLAGYASLQLGRFARKDLQRAAHTARRIGCRVAARTPELVQTSREYLAQHRPPHNARWLFAVREAFATSSGRATQARTFVTSASDALTTS